MIPANGRSGVAVEFARAPFDKSEADKHAVRWLILVLVAGFAYLYTNLFGIAGTPLFRTGDQSVFWTFAWRMLCGQVFLKDFHQFTPPGTDLVYMTAFHFFGPGIRTVAWTVLCLGLVLAVVCFLIARQIMPAAMAALTALLCLVLIYGDRMDATHHWFSMLANLSAILVLLPRRSSLRIAVAACLVGMAAFFTQTAGLTGLLAGCIGLWWEQRINRNSVPALSKQLAIFFTVTLGVWLLLSWRFIAQAGVRTYWNAQIVYLPRDLNFPTGFLFPDFHRAAFPRAWIIAANRLGMYLLLISICPIVAVWCMRRRDETRANSARLALLAALGILQALMVITMLNWNRMAAAALPAGILSVWLISRMRRAQRPLAAGCWCVVVAMMLMQSTATQVHRYHRVNMPTGSVLLQKEDADGVTWLVGHTRPGECFFEVSNTRFYAPLELRTPSAVDMLSTGTWTIPAWVPEAIAGLERCQAQYILWEPHTGIGTVGGMHQIATDHLDPLRVYMQQRYARVQAFSNGDEIWARKNREEPSRNVEGPAGGPSRP